jgi:hypothetical protein
MSWFSDTSSAPRISDGKTFTPDEITLFPFGTYKRTIVEESFRFEGMTQAAAESTASTYSEMSDSETDYFASSERANDAGGYRVRVATITKTDWELAT